MKFEMKCGCVGAEATFFSDEKLTRIDINKIKKATIQKLHGMVFLSTSAKYLRVGCIKHAELRYASVS